MARWAPPLRPQPDLIIPGVWEKRGECQCRGSMSRAAKARSGVRVGYARDAGDVVRFAAHELAAGLGAMLREAPRGEGRNGLEAGRHSIWGGAEGAPEAP